MKNIETIMSEAGIELTDEQKESVNKAVVENYITKAEHSKKIEKANAETESFKTKFEEADKTVNALKDNEAKWDEERAELNKKVEETDNHWKGIIEARDKEDAINNAIEGLEFSSISAKKSVIAEIKAKNLSLEDGKLIGVQDVINGLKESDPNAFKSPGNPKKFTSEKKESQTKEMTKDEIMKIKNSAERKEAIAQNKDLFM